MGVLGLRGQGVPVLYCWIFPWNPGNLWWSEAAIGMNYEGREDS